MEDAYKGVVFGRMNYAKAATPKEAVYAREDPSHQGGEKGRDGGDDGRVQGGEAPQRVEGRPDSDQSQAGNSDRPQTVGAEQSQRTVGEILAEGFEKERVAKNKQYAEEWAKTQAEIEAQRERAQAAEQRPVLAPYRVRVQLNDTQGVYLDLMALVPWPEWLNRLQFYHGIAHDKGFIPLHAIKYIVHIDEQGKPGMEMGENVLPFRKAPT